MTASRSRFGNSWLLWNAKCLEGQMPSEQANHISSRPSKGHPRWASIHAVNFSVPGYPVARKC